MAEITVKQLAGVVGAPVERLLEQIKDAGVKATSETDLISDTDKLKLLDFLRGQHGAKAESDPASSDDKKPKKITLKRKAISELKVGSSSGRSARTVAVEVRKKRVIQKNPPAATVSTATEETVIPKELEELEKLRADQAQRAEVREQELSKKQDRLNQQELEKKQEEELAKEKAEATVETKTAEEAKPKAAEKPAEKDSDTRRSKSGKNKDKSKTLYGRKELHVVSGSGDKRKKKKSKSYRKEVHAETKHGFEKPVDEVIRDVSIPETITVDELAKKMSLKAAELIKELMKLGVMATINQVIDQDTASLVVEELGHNPVAVKEEDVEDALLAGDDVEYDQFARAPVVTIMGHVDHGKTSLLDYIRETKVASGEAGGITQHIGAYHVETDKGVITFLDTPGHAAFTSMRERGASATDIVVLVVAADDGVMPQTIEAVQHSKAAGVTMIVAVNKMDKEGADPDRVKTELGNHEVIPEEWGGETIFVNVSAMTGDGVDTLLDAISLQAELMELKAPVEGPAKGVVLEASLDKGRGVTTTVLVQSGTLKQGDILLAGQEFGRVRAMFDESGQSAETAGPSMPVAVIGLSNAPAAGDDVLVVEDERTARDVTSRRRHKTRDMRLAGQQQNKMENLFDQMAAGEVKKLNILLKADVQGTLEAIKDSLSKLAADSAEVDVRIISSGVGGINETDISLAAASGAIVIGFNVRADAAARRAAAERGVALNYYSIIYELIDEVKKSLVGMLKSEFREQIIGLAEVKEVFKSPHFGQIAGSIVTEGTIRKSQPIRVLRNNVVVYEGELESLRRFKDNVNEVKSGTECGIGVKDYEVEVGDQIEVFEKVEVQRTL